MFSAYTGLQTISKSNTQVQIKSGSHDRILRSHKESWSESVAQYFPDFNTRITSTACKSITVGALSLHIRDGNNTDFVILAPGYPGICRPRFGETRPPQKIPSLGCPASCAKWCTRGNNPCRGTGHYQEC